MEVSSDKVSNLNLFDVVAPKPANDAAGPSFRDCLQSGSRPASSPPTPGKTSEPPRAPASPPERTEENSRAADNSNLSSDDDSARINQQSPVEEQPSRDEEKETDQEGAVIAAAITAITPVAEDQPTASIGDEAAITPQELATDAAATAAAGSAEQKADVNTAAGLEAGTPIAVPDVDSSATAIAEADAASADAVVPITDATKSVETDLPAKSKETRAVRASRSKDGDSSEGASNSAAPEGHAAKHDATTVTPVQQKPEDVERARDESEPLPEVTIETGANNSQPKVDPAVVAVDSASATSPELSASPTSENTSASPSAPAVEAPAAPVAKPPHFLLRAKAAASEGAASAAEIDPARFLHRVARAFQSAEQRGSEVRLRLHPAELGSLSIEVKVQEGVLTARVQAETPEARTALVDNLPQLRERLAEQGIRIDKFDVDLMDHSDRQPHQSQEDQQNRRASSPASRRASEPTASESRREPGLGRAGDNKGLNVVV